MSERLPFSSGEELISRAMGGANVCTYGLVSEAEVTTSAFSLSIAEKSDRIEASVKEVVCCNAFPVQHFTELIVLDCVHSFKWLVGPGRYKRFIARVAIELERKQTLSSGCALGLGSFTAMNPWPRAITITYINNIIIVLQYN